MLWFVILLLAVANGTLREKALIPVFGSAIGLIASGTILSLCIVAIAWAGAPWYGPLEPRQWVLVGIFWVVLTLGFEFGFGRLAQHKSWNDLLEAYTFKGGNIWPLVVVVTGVAPWLAGKMRGLL